MKGAIAKSRGTAAGQSRLVHSHAVRQSRQPGGPSRHDGGGDLGRYRRHGGHPGIGSRHRRHPDRRRRGPQEKEAGIQGGGGGARQLARSFPAAPRGRTSSRASAPDSCLPCSIRASSTRSSRFRTRAPARSPAGWPEEEGILIGISSGAALWAALQTLQAPGERRQEHRRDIAGQRREIPVHLALRQDRTGPRWGDSKRNRPIVRR